MRSASTTTRVTFRFDNCEVERQDHGKRNSDDSSDRTTPEYGSPKQRLATGHALSGMLFGFRDQTGSRGMSERILGGHCESRAARQRLRRAEQSIVLVEACQVRREPIPAETVGHGGGGGGERERRVENTAQRDPPICMSRNATSAAVETISRLPQSVLIGDRLLIDNPSKKVVISIRVRTSRI